MTPKPPEWIDPAWPAPPGVRACFTTRRGGCSAPPWNGLNLATHVGDDPADVARNRELLSGALDLPGEPVWLEQRHGRNVVRIDDDPDARSADVAHARTPGRVCAVLVADCVPVLLCDRKGREVAAVHAGWRGLAGGVIAAAVAACAAPPRDLLAWIGPAISAPAYQVGPEMRARFVAADAGAAHAFALRGGRWYMDLPGLVQRALVRLGVEQITASDACVYADASRFFSYRRDRTTGRMAALIWLG